MSNGEQVVPPPILGNIWYVCSYAAVHKENCTTLCFFTGAIGLHHLRIFTVRKRSCGKVMFSEACVKNSAHGGGGMHGRGACMVGGAWQGGVHGRGHAWQGACMAGGVCMAGGHAWQVGMHGGGACVAGGVHGGGRAW